MPYLKLDFANEQNRSLFVILFKEETDMKSMSNRQVRIPGPREHDVAEHCRKFGIGPAEEKKLKKLLGSHAPLHEIQANAPPRLPKWR